MFWSFLSNLFGATKAVAEEVTQRAAEKNTPTMQDNAAAATREEIATQATKDVAGGDATLNQLRKNASEN